MIWLENHFLWFLLYSVVGWVWEVIICSVPAKKFINRGFLNGPYCPIYGAGAILVVTLLSGIKNPILLFVVGAVLTCTLEYLTSWAMEKIFHTRWWDYSKSFLNINGRVCLLGAVAFGALSVIAVFVVHPVVVTYTLLLPELALSIISLVLFALLLIDVVYTLTRFSEFEAKLKELAEKLDNAAVSVDEMRKDFSLKLQDNIIYKKLSTPYIEMYKKINAQERRMIKAFPKLTSIRYHEPLERIKQYIFRKKDDEVFEEAPDIESQDRKET